MSEMNATDWFIRTTTETLGPFTLEIIMGLIERRRVTFGDFAWCAGMQKWTRIYECAEFQKLLPPTPSVPLPGKPTPRPDNDKAAMRRAPRVPFRGQFVTDAVGQFTIVNISQSGMLMRSDKLPPVGSEVLGRIESDKLPEPAKNVKVKVMRHTITPLFHGAGVVFVDYPEVHRAALFEYISSHAGDQLAYE